MEMRNLPCLKSKNLNTACLIYKNILVKQNKMLQLDRKNIHILIKCLDHLGI